MTLLSVIVPVYGVEPYIRKCIESILVQNVNMEIILVDDGSPDRCPEICDEYAKHDSRIIVVHQENRGLVEARRSGLQIAQGEYITFVDGDDWVEEDAYSKMLEYAKLDVEIIISGHVEEGKDYIKPIRNNCDSGIYVAENEIDECKKRLANSNFSELAVKNIDEVRKKAILFDKYYSPGIMASLSNKIFNRRIINLEEIHINPNIRMGEDAAFFYPLLYISRSLIIVNEIKKYHYRIVQNSMSRSIDDSYFQNAKHLADGLYTDLSSCSEAVKQLPYYVLYILEIGLFHYISIRHPYRMKRDIKKIREICSAFTLNKMLEIDMEEIFTRKEKKRVIALYRCKAMTYYYLVALQKIRGRMIEKI